jgi:proteasome lid subunit RPN8/RPN11
VDTNKCVHKTIILDYAHSVHTVRIGRLPLRKEAGFIDYKDRLREADQTVPSHDNRLEQNVPSSAFATFHTHPNESVGGQPDPSDADIQVAKKIGKPVYVNSEKGLFEVRPSDGKVIHVFKSPTWYSDKNPK